MLNISTESVASVQFTALPPIDWGNGVSEPMSRCRVVHTSGVAGFGCSYSEPPPREICDLFLQELRSKKTWQNPWLTHNVDGNFLDGFNSQNDVNCIRDVTMLSAWISGVDSALWDLKAKLEGKSLQQIIQESISYGDCKFKLRDSVLAYATVQLPIVFERSNSNVKIIDVNKTQEAVECALHKLLSKNFRAMKLYFPKPFGRFLDDNIQNLDGKVDEICFDVLRHARRVVGDDVMLMMESCGCYKSWRNDLDFVGKLYDVCCELKFAWLEEPLRSGDQNSQKIYRQFRKNRQLMTVDYTDHLDGPLVAGCESFLGFRSFLPWIQSRAVDLVQPDVGVAGGMSVLTSLKRHCVRQGFPLIPHGFGCVVNIALDIHLQSVVAVREQIICNKTLPAMVEVPARILDTEEGQVFQLNNKGHVTVPRDGPGIGVCGSIDHVS